MEDVYVYTLAACGVQATCTVLGLTPLDLGLLKSANLLFLLPRSPLGREPLYLQKESEKLNWKHLHSTLTPPPIQPQATGGKNNRQNCLEKHKLTKPVWYIFDQMLFLGKVDSHLDCYLEPNLTKTKFHTKPFQSHKVHEQLFITYFSEMTYWNWHNSMLSFYG